jgi:hypothetical protein
VNDHGLVPFESRAGILVTGNGEYCKISWPLGKVTVDPNGLTLETHFKQYRLAFTEIEAVRKGWLEIQIQHRSSGVPEYVKVCGFRLFRRLQDSPWAKRLPLRK